jgi:hypothetical protein
MPDRFTHIGDDVLHEAVGTEKRPCNATRFNRTFNQAMNRRHGKRFFGGAQHRLLDDVIRTDGLRCVDGIQLELRLVWYVWPEEKQLVTVLKRRTKRLGLVIVDDHSVDTCCTCSLRLPSGEVGRAKPRIHRFELSDEFATYGSTCSGDADHVSLPLFLMNDLRINWRDYRALA